MIACHIMAVTTEDIVDMAVRYVMAVTTEDVVNMAVRYVMAVTAEDIVDMAVRYVMTVTAEDIVGMTIRYVVGVHPIMNIQIAMVRPVGCIRITHLNKPKQHQDKLKNHEKRCRCGNGCKHSLQIS
jgi:large-conductance mechanosensitive channel